MKYVVQHISYMGVVKAGSADGPLSGWARDDYPISARAAARASSVTVAPDSMRAISSRR